MIVAELHGKDTISQVVPINDELRLPDLSEQLNQSKRRNGRGVLK